MPVPIGSRITPPRPVLAPPYGSKAEGWLCVSTLKTTLYCSSKRTTPALSRKTLTHQSSSPASRRIFSVAAKIVSRSMFSNRRSAVPVAVANPASQGLVAAMLAPRLGDRFQFDVARVAAERAEMGLDGLHLDQRQVELAFEAQSLQGRVVHRAARKGSSGGTRRASRLPAGGKPTARRPPARWRRWPGAWRPAAPTALPAPRRSSISSMCEPPRRESRSRRWPRPRSGRPGPSRRAWARRGPAGRRSGAERSRPPRPPAPRRSAPQCGRSAVRRRSARSAAGPSRLGSSSRGRRRRKDCEQAPTRRRPSPRRAQKVRLAVGRINVNFPKHLGSFSR